MKASIVIALITLLTSVGVCRASDTKLLLDHQRDARSLNGKWQMLLENGRKEVWKPAVARALKGWKTADVPGGLMKPADDVVSREEWEKWRRLHQTTKVVWIRRSFGIKPTEDCSAESSNPG